ncbi:MAG: DUF362 domain-containing protein [Clostridia bacterium]|nr:DUF362 domain-containing protein [Clostridia bacterium]
MKTFKAFLIYGILLVLLVVGISAGFFLKNNEKSVETVNALSNTVADVVQTADTSRIQSDNPMVGIAQGTDYDKVTREAVKNSGRLKEIVKKGDVVLIKPNLGAAVPSGTGNITDYRIVQAVADIVKEYGASRVIVAETSYMGNVFNVTGYDQLTGVELVDMNEFGEKDCYKLKAENSLTGKEFYIPKIYMDADVVISAAVLKTYSLVGGTLSLKNSIGVPPNNLYGTMGGKLAFHGMGIDNVIVDLNKIRKPDFAVIDGIIGGEGSGPVNNDPVNSNTVLAGSDLVAVDAVALEFMGLTLGEADHIRLAAENGLGECDLKKITVKGAVLDTIKMKFKH